MIVRELVNDTVQYKIFANSTSEYVQQNQYFQVSLKI